MMDGNTEARKGGAEAEKDAYCQPKLNREAGFEEHKCLPSQVLGL
jgi:hypothetical protein